MRSKVPLTRRTAAGITVSTALLLISLAIALITLFGAGGATLCYASAALAALAGAGYTYFGLSQETAAHYAIKTRRALAYGAVCFLGVLGAGLATVSFLFDGVQMSDSLIIKTVCILPAICGLIFLLATEPKRDKPWLKAMKEGATEAYMQSSLQSSSQGMDWAKWKENSLVDPIKAARFGVASGALWLFVIAVLITLGTFFSWQYAWLAPVFALPLQVLMVMGIFKKAKS